MKKAKKAKAVKEENGEVTGKKKGGKKKLLLIPVALVLVAAVAAAAVLFVLPRFGINLLGDSSEEPPLEEPLPKKGVQEYVVGEDSVPSLDTILEEGDGQLIALRSPGKKKGDSSAGVDDRFTYIYELNSFAGIMNRYKDLLTSSEQGFVITDETYLVLEEVPEILDAEGVLIFVRNAVEEGHLFQLVIGWSEASANLAVRVSAPEGKISYPKKEEAAKPNVSEPSSVSMQMEQLREMNPAYLGLPGTSMDDYTIFPVDGFVKVNEQDCRRFNVYAKDNPGSIAGTYFLSVDQQHIYVLNPSDNKVSTIK